MLWLGLISGLALILYATFLGSEGDGYRFMRRFGTTIYFGFTYLAQVLFAARIHSLAAAEHRLLEARDVRRHSRRRITHGSHEEPGRWTGRNTEHRRMERRDPDDALPVPDVATLASIRIQRSLVGSRLTRRSMGSE